MVKSSSVKRLSLAGPILAFVRQIFFFAADKLRNRQKGLRELALVAVWPEQAGTCHGEAFLFRKTFDLMKRG
jgi:hypothetical protein